MQAEQAQHDDVIFLPKPPGSSAGYRSIVYKTFALVEWVASNASPKFILKTDDDAYVNTANLVAALQRVPPFFRNLGALHRHHDAKHYIISTDGTQLVSIPPTSLQHRKRYLLLPLSRCIRPTP